MAAMKQVPGAVLAILAVIGCCQGEVQNGYRGYDVLSIKIHNQQQLDFLIDLKAATNFNGNTEQIEFWNEPTEVALRTGNPVLILAAPEKQAEIKRLLQTQDIDYDVSITDVRQAIEAESPTILQKDDAEAKLSWSAYHRYPAMERYITELPIMYPHLAKVETIGVSYEGRSLYLLKISTPAPNGRTKPAIWIDANIHAREWVTSATITYFINKLTSGYASNSTSKRLVDQLDWYFVPVVNPDGFDFTHQSANNRMWRRTRRINPFSQCLGSDPNRNHDTNWMYAGANQDPCSDLYAGPYPFSEVENVHVTDAIFERKDQVKAFVGLHSFSQAWLVPWGHNNSYPVDNAGMRALADRGTAALTRRYGTDYRFGNPTEALGSPGAGGTMDWTKAKANIKYSLTFELRDRGRYGFILPANQIIPTGEETFEAIIEIARTVYDEFAPTLN